MSYASTTDVQDRLGRPLTTDELTQVATLLDDVELILKTKIPDLVDQVEDEDTGEAFLAIVTFVEANAVKRLIRNPDGYTSETDGDYTYQINYRLASGELAITDKEWSMLGINSGVFFIHPKVRTPFESAALTLDPSSVEYAVWAMNSSLFWYDR